jgi:hypothetical protein
MMPSKKSCMPLLERMGMMYEENNGVSLCQESNYEPIFTRFVRTRSLLSMW